MTGTDPWHAQMAALGAYIRAQRDFARLSLRELAQLTGLSNAYLSQVERGLHAPSIRVLRAIALGLGLSPDELLKQAGLVPEAERGGAGGADEQDPAGSAPDTEATIMADPGLSEEAKRAVLAVYRSLRASQGREGDSGGA